MDQVKSHKIEVKTYGCKVNTYDSGLIEGRLTTLAKDPVFVLNTCAVTREATKEALREARRLKKKHPSCKVVVTGCSAQVDTDDLAAEAAIDLVVANSHKGQLKSLIEALDEGQSGERVFKSNIFQKEDLEAGGGLEAGHTRSFLKIQDGCDSFCTFCVIPFARGKSRSLSVDELVARVQDILDQGVMEIVLTGVHIGDYRGPHGESLADLVEAVLQRTEVQRLRLSSLEPVELNDKLIELFQDPRVCPHFHMSIQSANSRVLGAMKRQYDANAVVESLNRIAARVPSAFVGMDVIAGFPTETIEEHQDTCLRLGDLPWTRLHVFPYSARPLTYAARLKQLDPPQVAQRAAELRQLSDERLQMAASRQLGAIKSVLVLNQVKGEAIFGLARDYWHVALPKSLSSRVGEEIQAEIQGFERHPWRSGDLPLMGRLLEGL